MSARLPVYRAERPYEVPPGTHGRPGVYAHEDTLREALGPHLHEIAAEAGTKARTLYWWVDRHEPSRPGPGRRLSKLLRIAHRDHGVPAQKVLAPLRVIVREVVAELQDDECSRKSASDPLARFAAEVAALAGLDVVWRDIPDLTPAGTLDRVRRCTAEQADVMRAALAGADGWTEEELAALEREVGELVTAAHALLRGARAERRGGNGGGGKKP